MSDNAEPIELTEAEATVLVKVTAATYHGTLPTLDQAERAALRRASIKAQGARDRFPLRVAR